MKETVNQTQQLKTRSMQWLEVIELRSVESNRELLESHLQAVMDEVDKDPSAQAIKAYRRVMIDSDVSIHLIRNSEDVEKSGGSLSALGVRLASALKEFGLVNHSIWIEIQNT